MPTQKNHRKLLSDDVTPDAYKLTLEPDFDRFTFSGTVEVSCEVHVATDAVVLHAHQLSVVDVTFQVEGDHHTIYADTVTMMPKDLLMSISFNEVLPVGRGTLTITFNGILNNQMKGFYRSQFINSQGCQAFLATTHFEPIDARRCFPCWDEPARKAVFTITLVCKEGMVGVSNMPESRSEVLSDGRRRITFLPTPKMSTYLLAFCIGEFDFVQQQALAGTIVRVLSVPGKSLQCSFALNCAVKALNFYNQFFKAQYPLPKLDLIAIPDFPIGAMENWGLVTYRESALLCIEKEAATARKQRICAIIAHELSHMWFGNLVTMQWWDDLWLKEGFANWMESFCSDHLFPEWGVWESYICSQQSRALALDALRSSHPVEVPIARAEEVEEVFDAISYCKGGSVVRMAHAVLGPQGFRQGLDIYFQKHSYGNTETADLWNALEEASGQPLVEMMHTWTSQMGFPMLSVLGDPFDGSGEVGVEQSWFLSDASTQTSEDDKTWIVPVLITTDKGTMDMQFLREKRQKLNVHKDATWLKLNAGQHIPCRILYPPKVFRQLISAVVDLPAVDRIGLLLDTLALCEAGHVKATELIHLVCSFEHEANDKVWLTLHTVLTKIDAVFVRSLPSDVYERFATFAAGICLPCATKVGWNDREIDDDNVKRLRQTMVALLARFCRKSATVAADARAQCDILLSGGVISQNVQSATLSIALHDDPALFQRIIELHNRVDDPKLKSDIYAALGAAPSEYLLRQALDWALTKDVRAQDMHFIPASIAGGNPDLVFKWIGEQYTSICSRVPPGGILFQHMVRISGAGYMSNQDAAALLDFWKEKSVYAAIRKTVNQVVEDIKGRAKFADAVRGSSVSSCEFWLDLAPR